MRRVAIGLLWTATLALAAGCGPATVRPVSFPDPDVGCPGARLTWALQIEDQRAIREAEARMFTAVRDAVQKSFPGCRWGTPEADAGTISIEVHRFAAHLDAGSWEAAVEWTVSARDAGGHTLTQFEVNEEVSRPNYQGSDNEKESLSEAFRKAVERTARGLTAVSISGILRHPQGTAAAAAAGRSDSSSAPSTRSADRSSTAAGWKRSEDSALERISQPLTAEDL